MPTNANPFGFDEDEKKPARRERPGKEKPTGRRRNDEDDDDRDERPSRKSKSGGSAGLIIGLALGGVILLGGAGVAAWFIFGADTKPKATVTINGQAVVIDEGDIDKAMKEAAEAQAKNMAKAFGDMDKTKAPKGKGKPPKDAGKMPSDADINKALEKALGKGAKDKETDPRLTVKPESFPLPEKSRGQVHLPRGRKDMFVLANSFIKTNVAAKEASKEFHIRRFDLRNGKELGSFTLNLSHGVGGVEDISPDGGLLAIRNFALGQDLTNMGITIVSLADGKFLTRTYKPAYTRTNPDGKKVPVGAKGLRFLDSRRWLIVYEDNAADVWTNSDSGWQRKQIRAGTPPPDKAPPFYAPPNAWCVSTDSKTLAMWNGQGFDLIDTTTGAVRGRTANLEPQGGESNLIPSQAVLSPDGSRVVAAVSAMARNRRKGFHACFPADSSKTVVRCKSAGSAEMVWWGNQHLLHVGNPGNWRLAGIVFDATTGNPLADFDPKGSLVKYSHDGKMRLINEGYGHEQPFLVQCAFPEKLLEELKKPRDKGLPVIQANQTGVGIRP